MVHRLRSFAPEPHVAPLHSTTVWKRIQPVKTPWQKTVHGESMQSLLRTGYRRYRILLNTVVERSPLFRSDGAIPRIPCDYSCYRPGHGPGAGEPTPGQGARGGCRGGWAGEGGEAPGKGGSCGGAARKSPPPPVSTCITFRTHDSIREAARADRRTGGRAR